MSSNTAFRILQISTNDRGGGAEMVAWTLHQQYRALGHDAWLAVGRRFSDNPYIVPIHHDTIRRTWGGLCQGFSERCATLIPHMQTAACIRYWVGQVLADPYGWYTRSQGVDGFYSPDCVSIPELVPGRPQVLHAHNLHGQYFNLRALPGLSHCYPFVMTLHDAWLLSGHCAHSFNCNRWMAGCGQCPDLSIYPSLPSDNTANIWRLKQQIYRHSRCYVATPSYWMMDRVTHSILIPGIVEAKVIPNGIDTDLFHPGDRHAARAAIDIPQSAPVLLFVANNIKRNIWKDYSTLFAAIEYVGEHWKGEPIICLALGEKGQSEYLCNAEIRFIPYIYDRQKVAQFYQASDLYIHAARIETFPMTILEAFACGIPVVATAVGGIPEQIVEGKTGYLTPKGDAGAMGEAILCLLRNDKMRLAMGYAARERAVAYYTLQHQVDTYLQWYKHIVNDTRINSRKITA